MVAATQTRQCSSEAVCFHTQQMLCKCNLACHAASPFAPILQLDSGVVLQPFRASKPPPPDKNSIFRVANPNY